MIGITLKETHHGNPGEKRILPAGLRVRLEPAANLPASSETKYWASPLEAGWPVDTAQWAQDVGVGLYADDVRVISP